jgi:hypothetical protein
MANNITVLDFSGTSRILKTTDNANVHTPHHNIEVDGVAPAMGAGAAGSSALRTITSTDDAIHGALTETAPATDTASSGLNGRLQRIAQRLTSLIALVPASLGSKAAASSFAVTDSTEDIARMGIVTETAPATDTASSGLNGRLQRIAQRITSLIALVPASLGSKAASASFAVTDSTEDIARIGIVTETAPATDTASSGLNGRLQRIAQKLSAGYSAAVTLTRTADTNAYLANDVVGAATGSTAALTFANMGPSGAEIMLTSVSLEIDAAAIISGETSYNLWLYGVTPPSALGDNAPFDIPSGDRASLLAKISLGTPVDEGSTLFVQTDIINKQIKLAGTSLFGYLVTVGAHTPTSARVYVITLHSMAV